MAGHRVGAQLTSVTSGGATATNGANISDATAIAAAAAVPATAGAVALGGHAGFSVLGKATTGTGNEADIAVSADSVVGRSGSGDVVGNIAMTAAGRAMAGAASATAQTALLDNVTSTTKGLAPLSGGGTANFLRADGTWAPPPGTGGGAVTSLTGDVTGTGPGATATTIANDAVTNAKAANMANATIKARITAGTGDPEDANGTQVTALLDLVSTSAKGLAPVSPGGTSAFLRADGTWVTPPGTGGGGPLTGLSGDVTTSGGGVAPATISNDAVTFAKMQNLATDTLVGRDTAGTGDPESITVGGGIEFTGSGGIQRSALTGDVSASAGSAGTVINAGVVTNAQLAVVPTGTLKGRTAAGTGAPTDLTLAAVKTALAISFADVTGTLQAAQFPALTGDVTTPGGSLATTLATTGVGAGTYGDGSHVAQVTVDAKGRVTAASSPSISIAAGAVSGLAAIATSGSASDLGAGTVPAARMPALTGDVTTVAGTTLTTIASTAVDNGKLNNMVSGRFKARMSPGTGTPEDITPAQARTLLSLDTPQSYELEVSFGTTNGTSSESVTPGSFGTSYWPFWLMPVTKSSDVSVNGYIGAGVDANLNIPEIAWELLVDATYTRCDLLCAVTKWDPQSSGGATVNLSVSINTLIDSSPAQLTLTGVGNFATGLVSYSFVRGNRIGVRLFPGPTWGNTGTPHLKLTVKVRLYP